MTELKDEPVEPEPHDSLDPIEQLDTWFHAVTEFMVSVQVFP